LRRYQREPARIQIIWLRVTNEDRLPRRQKNLFDGRQKARDSLDEISELDMAQLKGCALQNAGRQELAASVNQIDVRVVAATNKDFAPDDR